LRKRIEMLVHDLHVYGAILSQQRSVDLEGTLPGFLALSRRTG
jgi:hypothetical protein